MIDLLLILKNDYIDLRTAITGIIDRSIPLNVCGSNLAMYRSIEFIPGLTEKGPVAHAIFEMGPYHLQNGATFCDGKSVACQQSPI